jgi:nitrogen regulatory protein PII 2
VKEVVAILRRQKVADTRQALADIGYPGCTLLSVHGRGKQGGIGGILGEIDPEMQKFLSPEEYLFKMDFIPKRMYTLVVPDEAVPKVVQTIIQTNQTGNIGDGKIFVLPTDDATTVRTGKTGDKAL